MVELVFGGSVINGSCSVSKKRFCMKRGGGRVQTPPPKKDDIICEQPLIAVIGSQQISFPFKSLKEGHSCQLQIKTECVGEGGILV